MSGTIDAKVINTETDYHIFSHRTGPLQKNSLRET